MQNGWPDLEDNLLSESIFGTAEKQQVCCLIEEWATEHGFEGATVTEIEMSVGAGITIVAADGHRTFIKVWPSSFERSELAAQMQVQQTLHATGFPAPAVLTPVASLATGWAVAMSYDRPGNPTHAHSPAIRRAMAETLARLIRDATRLSSPAGLPRLVLPVETAIWPKPHNVLFDFEATKPGAEWIDAIAREALASLQDPVGRIVIGHNDWSAKNLRTNEQSVATVYDWDAIMIGPETLFVGTAAAHFPATWEIDVALTPSWQEMTAFVRDYEAARDVAFAPTELSEIEAAITYARAYKARCEHALHPGQGEWNGSSREALSLYGAFRFSAC